MSVSFGPTGEVGSSAVVGSICCLVQIWMSGGSLLSHSLSSCQDPGPLDVELCSRVNVLQRGLEMAVDVFKGESVFLQILIFPDACVLEAARKIFSVPQIVFSPVQFSLGSAEEDGQDHHHDHQQCSHGPHTPVHQALAGAQCTCLSPVPVCVRGWA